MAAVVMGVMSCLPHRCYRRCYRSELWVVFVEVNGRDVPSLLPLC